MNLSKETLYRMLSAGTIQHFRIGKLYRFSQKQLDHAMGRPQ
jgi:excisionase family DNA binding protein